jgi:hypothetical protein
LVEVETNGATFEQDGRTPQLLYERHVAWRQAKKISLAMQSAFAAPALPSRNGRDRRSTRIKAPRPSGSI